MIKKIKKGLSTRKVKIFLGFLLCSFLAWFISNLSESYTHGTVFDITYVNVPDSLLLTEVSKEKINVKLKTNGFQFLGFNLKLRKVDADLSFLQFEKGNYFLPPENYKEQIERQLSKSIQLLEIDKDTIFFDFHKIHSKEVPVVAKVKVFFEQNYLLNGTLQVQPDHILIKGPMHEIDTIDHVETEELVLRDLTSDFSEELGIYKAIGLKDTKFSSSSIEVSGEVAKFSEKIIEIPVEVINLPEGAGIRTFPDMVRAVCKAEVNQLKELTASDFKLIADYSVLQEKPSKTLRLRLIKEPLEMYSVKLMRTEVEFILKRE